MATNKEESWKSGFVERVEAALPIDDLVGWLVHEFPGASEQDVLAMVQDVYRRDYDIKPSATAPREHQVGGKTWQAFPQRVAKRP